MSHHLGLLKNVNVRFNTEGNLELRDSDMHGCAVFATGGSQAFELSMTAVEDDRWSDEDRAGSFCVGVISLADIKRICYPDGDELAGTWRMARDVRRHYALSTGTFKLCESDYESTGTFKARLFNINSEDRIFPGSLDSGRTLAMEYKGGVLTYKLDGLACSFKVDSGTSILPSSGKGAKGKGKGWAAPWAAPMAKGGGKGYGKSHGKGKDGEDEDLDKFAPCVWMFANSSPQGISINLRRNTRDTDVPSKRMRTLWDDRRFADCTIECGGEHIQAHRAVLCAASPVFNAAFSGSMREAQEARYSIQTCSQPLAVRAILEFIYTGSLPELPADMLVQLLPLAAQYELDDLCSVTADRLIAKLNVQTVRETVRVIRQFRERASISESYAVLLSILRAREDLLSESLV